MLISNWLLIGAAEIFSILSMGCLLLLLYVSKLKKLVSGLKQKLSNALKDLKKLRKDYNDMEANLTEASSYDHMLDQQIKHNREYHAALNPGRDIALDLSEDAPLPRQLASIRHAFLLSEKEAYTSSDYQPLPNWTVLQAKLGRLKDFFVENVTTTTLEHTEELEADTQSPDATIEHLQTTIDKQQRNIDELEHTVQRLSAGTVEHVNEPPTLKPADPSDEVAELKSVTSKQHKMIADLQERLKIAYAAGDTKAKDALLQDLQAELSQQVRYMQESETCIRLLEEEVDLVNRQVEQLQAELDQSEKMIMALQSDPLDMKDSPSDTQTSNDELNQLTEQLQVIQQEYIELESKYLALKMKG